MSVALAETKESVPYFVPIRAYSGEYAWKPGSRITIDPEVAAQRLIAIQQETGCVMPESVIEDARPEDAPLHPVFEWDDDIAARQYRLFQAHHLMRSLTVPTQMVHGDSVETVHVRAYVSVPMRPALPEGGEEEAVEGRIPRAYMPVQRVMEQEDYRKQVIMQAGRELGWWRRKYEHLSELAELFAAIDRHIPNAV